MKHAKNEIMKIQKIKNKPSPSSKKMKKLNKKLKSKINNDKKEKEKWERVRDQKTMFFKFGVVFFLLEDASKKS